MSRFPNLPMASKPVRIQSVSGDGRRRLRLQHHLRQVLAARIARVFVKPDMMISRPARRFIENGNLNDRLACESLGAQIEAFADLGLEALRRSSLSPSTLSVAFDLPAHRSTEDA